MPVNSNGHCCLKKFEMINKKRIIFYIAIVLIICGNISCKPLLKIIYGLKVPRIESKSNISKFAEKSGLDLLNVFIFDEDTVYNNISEDHLRPKLRDKILIFNNNGFFLLEDTTKIKNSCVVPETNIFNVISDLYTIDSNQHINILNRQLSSIINYPIPDYTQYDYTLIYYWAKWYKGFSKRRFKEINEILASINDSIRINVQYVNIDLLDTNYSDSLLKEKPKMKLKLNIN